MKSAYTMAGLFIALLGAVVLFAFSTTTLSLLLVVGGLGAAGYGLFLEAKGKDALREAAMRHIETATGAADSPAQRLRRELSKMRFESHVETDAARALAQLDLAEERLRRLEGALRAKLNPGEVTYERYLGAGRQVYDVIVSGLGEVAGILPVVQGARSMAVSRKERYVPGRAATAQLASGALPAEERAKERRLDDLLRGNERALREMDTAVVAVTRWQTGQDLSQDFSKRLEASLAELHDLAAQAEKYR